MQKHAQQPWHTGIHQEVSRLPISRSLEAGLNFPHDMCSLLPLQLNTILNGKSMCKKIVFLLPRSAMEETTERLSYKRCGREDRAEREKANNGVGIPRERLVKKKTLFSSMTFLLKSSGREELRLLLFCVFHGCVIRGHQGAGTTSWPLKAGEQGRGGGMGQQDAEQARACTESQVCAERQALAHSRCSTASAERPQERKTCRCSQDMP